MQRTKPAPLPSPAPPKPIRTDPHEMLMTPDTLEGLSLEWLLDRRGPRKGTTS